jgi:hypothetical protein
LTGTDASLSVRCAGWFSSWLVLLTNTDDSRSKVSWLSGLGYSMRGHWSAGFNAAWSGLL